MESRQDPQEVFDSIRRQKFDTGLQPFKLVKYFSFTSLGVILVFTLILSWIISNHARRVMLEQSQEYVLLLAENINQQVFRRFVLPAVVRYGGIALSNPEQFENLDRIVRGLIQGLKIDSVTIFDSRVNIISYSTVPELVGVKDKGGVEYEQALKGKANSRFIYRGSVFSLLSVAPAVRCQLRAYIPFRQVREDGESGEVIMGVIEIVKDLSNNYASIIDLQSRIILVSAAVMGVLFLVLRTIVSRAAGSWRARPWSDCGSRRNSTRRRDWRISERWSPPSPTRSRVRSASSAAPPRSSKKGFRRWRRATNIWPGSSSMKRRG